MSKTVAPPVTDFRLEPLGLLMEPERGNPQEVEGTLNPAAGLEPGIPTAERLRAAIADKRFDTPQGELGVSISLRIAERRHGEALEAVLERADQALYAAKAGGRNRVVGRHLRRRQLFEVKDQPWLPRLLRDFQTDFLVGLSAVLGLYDSCLPQIREQLARSGEGRVVDLASGNANQSRGWAGLRLLPNRSNPQVPGWQCNKRRSSCLSMMARERRIGLLHLGHCSGSTAQVRRMRAAQRVPRVDLFSCSQALRGRPAPRFRRKGQASVSCDRPVSTEIKPQP